MNGHAPQSPSALAPNATGEFSAIRNELPEPVRVPIFFKGQTVAVALIDAEDSVRVLALRWRLVNGYAARGKRASTMHRFILNLPPRGRFCLNPEVDHINRDRLDNRRENLRVVTRGENAQNLGSRAGSSSRHRGVSCIRGRWKADIKVRGEAIYLGLFDSEAEAARVAASARALRMPFSSDANAWGAL